MTAIEQREPIYPTSGEVSGSVSGLAAALVWLSAHHGRAVTARALAHGLPLPDNGEISPELTARAAANAGLETAWVQRSLADVPQLVLPAVIVIEGKAHILLRTDDELGVALVLDPTTDSAQRRTEALSALGTRMAPLVLFARPATSASPAALLQGDRSIWAMSWFWDVVRHFRGHYITVGLAAFLINLLALAFPLFTMTLYDRIVPNGATASLTALSIGVALSFVFDAVLRMARSKVIDQAGKQADLTLTGRIFEQVMNLPLRFRPGNVGVLSNQIRDFDGVREFLTSSTLVAFADLVFAFLFVAVIVLIAGPLAFVLLALVPVLLLVGFFMQGPLEKAARLLQQEASARHGLLIESLSGFETIKVLGAQGRRQRLYERAVAAAARSGEAVHHWSLLGTTLTNTLQQFGQLLLYVVGTMMVISNQMSIGALVATGMLMMRVITPITNMSAMLARSAQTLIALRGIDAIMQLPTERPSGQVFTARTVKDGQIAFDNVSFTYPGSTTPALQEVSFTIERGERVGLIGRIGSGKTTLGRLLAALHLIDDGRILIDGADIRQFDPVNLRAGVGIVQQDVDLFHGTLRDNIVIGRPDVSDEMMLNIAKVAGVDTFAALHPSGYDMVLTDGGRSLSGGQRQTVALARVLLREPRIIFMDEPTAALDIASEERFCSALDKALPEGTTLLIATHRTSLLAHVDRILVFDQGKLIADGPRDQILQQISARARP